LKHLRTIRDIFNTVIDWSYPIFAKFLPKSTYKYAFNGGINTSFDIFLYFAFYNFILNKQDLNLGLVVISPHIASFLLTFPLTFVSGFLLSKYITFTESDIRGRVQLVRYGITVLVCIFLNYVFLKLFVEFCGFYPTVSKILTTFFVITYSYFSQKHFTFKIENKVNI
jgi:putative flippase GtrA